MYFQNYYASGSIKLESFTNHLQHLRTCSIRYTTTLAFGSSLYIRYNTAGHVVSSTHKTAIKNMAIFCF